MYKCVTSKAGSKLYYKNDKRIAKSKIPLKQLPMCDSKNTEMTYEELLKSKKQQLINVMEGRMFLRNKEMCGDIADDFINDLLQETDSVKEITKHLVDLSLLMALHVPFNNTHFSSFSCKETFLDGNLIDKVYEVLVEKKPKDKYAKMSLEDLKEVAKEKGIAIKLGLGKTEEQKRETLIKAIKK
jgi:hypothetical protein